jgi:hypothetical protein
MGDKDVGVRRAAVTALIQIGPTAEGNTALATALSDPAGDIRELAAGALIAASAVPNDSRRLLTAVARERFTQRYLEGYRQRGRQLEGFAARLCAEYGGPTFLYPSTYYSPRSGYGARSAIPSVVMGKSYALQPVAGPVDNPSERDPIFSITWPPPDNFDSRVTLDGQTLAEKNAQLHVVYDRLVRVLQQPEKGFGTVRLYRVTHQATQNSNFGFALITRPVAPDGTRVSVSANPLDLAGAMAQEREPGHLRIAAFVVVRDELPPPGTGMFVDIDQLNPELDVARPTPLPGALAPRQFGEFQFHLLVYECRREREGTVRVTVGGGPAAARAFLRDHNLPFQELGK